MRLSFIGSVNYEAMAAGFGAQAMGKTLQTMDTMAFACGVRVHGMRFPGLADFHLPVLR